jgi:hypothetical protein
MLLQELEKIKDKESTGTGAILITQKHISQLTKHIKNMCERQKCATHC